MTDFTYEQIIEYEDCTYDVNFEAARDWAKIIIQLLKN